MKKELLKKKMSSKTTQISLCMLILNQDNLFKRTIEVTEEEDKVVALIVEEEEVVVDPTTISHTEVKEMTQKWCVTDAII